MVFDLESMELDSKSLADFRILLVCESVKLDSGLLRFARNDNVSLDSILG